MAAGTALQVTSGSGPYLALGSAYTESGKTVADQKVILGEPYLPTYAVGLSAVAVPAAGGHYLEIRAGASLNVRLRRLRLSQVVAGTAGTIVFAFFRLTTAGTGTGNAVSAFNPTDPAAGATVISPVTGAGTNGGNMHILTMPQSATAPFVNCGFDLMFGIDLPPIIIPAGTANGLALQVVSAPGGGCQIAGFLELAETPF